MMEAWDVMGALRRLWAGKPIRGGMRAEEAPSDVKVLPRMFNVERDLGEMLLAEKVAKLKASPLPDEAHAVIRLGVLRDLYERVLWVDNPEWDGTDGAHPAWWRGQEDGVKGAVTRLGRHWRAMRARWPVSARNLCSLYGRTWRPFLTGRVYAVKVK